MKAAVGRVSVRKDMKAVGGVSVVRKDVLVADKDMGTVDAGMVGLVDAGMGLMDDDKG